VHTGEFGAAIEESELHGESCAGYSAAQLLDEFHCGGCGAAGGEQIVADQYGLAGLDRILVDLELSVPYSS